MQNNSTVNLTPEIEELLDKAIKGNGDAFGRLYDMYVERIYQHIFYRIGNRAEAEDLTQQVFLKAWKALPKYRKKSRPFTAWLYTISNNLVIDFYRKNKNNKTTDIDNFVHTLKNEKTLNPEQAAEAQQNTYEIWSAIQQLPQNQQQIIVMRFLDGYSNPEVADLVGSSEGSIRVAVHRALIKLRQIMQREEVE